MPERSSYAAGTPCWVDMASADLDASIAFYSNLFGWEVPERPDSAEMGGYRRALKDGADVAGIYPQMMEGVPPNWMTHIAVDDADAIAAKVREAGGQVIAEPMALPHGIGKLAVFSDSTGAALGVWEGGEFAGAVRVNEAGTFGWNELGTRDTAAAKEFYAAVFGWAYEDEESERAGTYTVCKVGDAMVGGMLDLDAIGLPAEVPPHWLTYFVVDDTDATAEQARAGGGEVRFGPIDIPIGRFAVLSDQFGAVFAVMQPADA